VPVLRALRTGRYDDADGRDADAPVGDILAVDHGFELDGFDASVRQGRRLLERGRDRIDAEDATAVGEDIVA
jgi:hypothetical protein